MALATIPILDIVDPKKLFVLEIDASGEAISAILMQGGRLATFESNKLDHMQWNYSAYE